MLRITSVTPDGSPSRLRVEGRIAGPWVDELSRVASLALGRSGRVILDLSGVTFVDRSGVALLRGLSGRGVELAGCSTFVASLIAGGVE